MSENSSRDTAYDVFISYSHTNKTVVDALCHFLEEKKIRCWIAPRNILPGKEYGEVINQAIRCAKIFVVVFSNNSSNSHWVRKETNLAVKYEKIIVPFRIEDCVPSGAMETYLNDVHWIDAFPEPDPAFCKLAEAISAILGITLPPPPKAPQASGARAADDLPPADELPQPPVSPVAPQARKGQEANVNSFPAEQGGRALPSASPKPPQAGKEQGAGSKPGLRDFIKRQKEEQEMQRAVLAARKRDEAVEAIPVEPHPLCGEASAFIDLYVKSVLILRSELPLEYSDPEEGKKQLRLFARSLGLSKDRQYELEKEVSSFDEPVKEVTLSTLSAQGNADDMTCFMCDVARLHGWGYKFEGDFADLWRGIACVIAKFSGDRLAATEKLCRDIASGREVTSLTKYAPISEKIICYFGKEAFANAIRHSEQEQDTNGQYLVIDLSGGPNAAEYPFFSTNEGPELADNSCRTTELWLRHIPAGSFRRTWAIPQHIVLPSQDYFMGIFPVTQRQWELVMGNNPSKFKGVGPEAPVEQVSYDDICGPARPWPKNSTVTALSFLGKLRRRTGMEGFDLPTEAQWEYACQAGTTTKYSFGDMITPVRANYANSEIDKTTKVGSYPPNAWGLYDMHGNVWEWCSDWFPDSRRLRVYRGGGWGSPAESCRTAHRNGGASDTRHEYLGFRLVFVPAQGQTKP